MSQLALPIYLEQFSFQRILFADPGDGLMYPRASHERLAFLLLADQPNVLADEPWGFYSAQLIHYGLGFTNDKVIAKNLLRDALNNSTLAVPNRILRLEDQMRMEWHEDQLREEAYIARKANLSARPTKGKNRRHPFGAENSAANAPVQKSPLRRISNTLRSCTVNAFEQLGALGGPQRKEKDPLIRMLNEQAKKRMTTVPSSLSSRNANNFLQAGSPVQSMPRRERKEVKTPTLMRRLWNRSSISTPEMAIPLDPLDFQGSHVLLAGKYLCVIGGAGEGKFSSDEFDLTLNYDFPRGVWWAKFFFGPWEAIIQINPGPMTAEDVHLGRSFSFSWQVRDVQQGSFEAGLRCTGDMKANWQEISIRMFGVPGVGLLQFEGVRLENLPIYGDLQQEWDNFSAYPHV